MAALEIRDDGTGTAHVVAELLGVTAQRVRQLVREGVFPREGRGRYPVAECVRAYVAFWQERAHRSQNGGGPEYKESRARKEAALAEKHELEVSRIRGELVPVDAVEAQIRDALEPVDLGLRTAHSRLGPSYAGRLGVSEGEALHLVRDMADDLRAHLVSVLDGEGVDELPEGFPHRALLAVEGIETFSELRDVDELTDVPGIGPKRAREIMEVVG